MKRGKQNSLFFLEDAYSKLSKSTAKKDTTEVHKDYAYSS